METPTRKGGTLPLHGAHTAFSCYPALRLYRLSKSPRGIDVVSLTLGNSARYFKSDEHAETKVLAAVLQAAGKQKLIATDETQKPLPEYHNVKTSQKNLAPRDLEMRVTINHFGYRTIRVPGHFEDYTTQETHYYYDKDGKRHYWTEDVVRQRWVPESFYPYAQLSLIYNFYDLSDGTLVASFSDSRNREYENAPAGGMLNRSLKDCFKKIFRK